MKLLGFYVLLASPIFLWAVIYVPAQFDALYFMSESAVDIILRVSPIVGGDLSVFGEVTPFVLASAIVAFMPVDKDSSKNAVFAISLITYVIYIHLSFFFGSGQGVGLIAAVATDVAIGQKKILSIVSNVRVMSLVLMASMLGLHARKQRAVEGT